MRYVGHTSRYALRHATNRQTGRRYFSKLVESEFDEVTSQRYTNDGRLVIETTNMREPAWSYEASQELTEQREQKERRKRTFRASSKLPAGFFDDIENLQTKIAREQNDSSRARSRSAQLELRRPPQHNANLQRSSSPQDQTSLLAEVRELEDRLARAKKMLDKSLQTQRADPLQLVDRVGNAALLTKEDYLNLVDLYFYSHNSRFSPESPDASPNPIIVEDYASKLSSDYNQPQPDAAEDVSASTISFFDEIEKYLKSTRRRELAIMRLFVDLLLNDNSNNLMLFEAYKQLPRPGVAYLPKGVIRLFLQRMGTPGVRTKEAMIRYLSLVDDMQEAKIPITTSEWSTAIFLAGRTRTDFRDVEVSRAFDLWRQMENEAGVRSSYVTFNILFDIAARAGKFALAENVLAEMFKRDLRLNKLGRISLIYYHGLRGDGDGVRKAYHDYVEAGEIVDTRVLNCVISSLINAQESAAAEQIYQRMRDLQKTFVRGIRPDGKEALFKRHPGPGSSKLGDEMAANALGRTLLRSANLKNTAPEAHQRLQASMPLTPDWITFRSMINYHATISGDLDRLTVLLSEMIEDYKIPCYPSLYQILFKGFAINGSKVNTASTWNKKRLDLTWNACRSALKVGAALAANIDPESISLPKFDKTLAETMKHSRIHLPTVQEVYESAKTQSQVQSQLTESVSVVDQYTLKKSPRKLSLWEELVVDLAAFPRERLRRLKRYHAEQFDEVPSQTDPDGELFQEAHYSAPQAQLDAEEGEYVLPDPVYSSLYNPDYNPFDSTDDVEIPATFEESIQEATITDRPDDQTQFTAFNSTPAVQQPPPRPRRNVELQDKAHERTRTTKGLVCWLLRAYTRVTSNRAQVEEIWSSVRKYWYPINEREVQTVLRVLRRCLEECDLKGSGGYRSGSDSGSASAFDSS